MNDMQMLKNSIINKNRIVANVVLRKLQVDIADLRNDPVDECGPDFGLALMELPNGDQFYVAAVDDYPDSYKDLPVFSRKDFVGLKDLIR
jgi:hypothetical protein